VQFYTGRTGGGIYAHDASAVACALDPSRFGLRRGAMRVITEGAAMGQTLQAQADARVELAGRPPQAACIEVDACAVLADFGACFGI
jgi:inosine-uridine nucleoside N-ribohydrolase